MFDRSLWRLAVRVTWRRERPRLMLWAGVACLLLALMLPVGARFGPELVTRVEYFIRYGVTRVYVVLDPEQAGRIVLSAYIAVVLAHVGVFLLVRHWLRVSRRTS